MWHTWIGVFTKSISVSVPSDVHETRVDTPQCVCVLILILHLILYDCATSPHSYTKNLSLPSNTTLMTILRFGASVSRTP